MLLLPFPAHRAGEEGESRSPVELWTMRRNGEDERVRRCLAPMHLHLVAGLGYPPEDVDAQMRSPSSPSSPRAVGIGLVYVGFIFYSA